MLNISELAADLNDQTAWQETPEPVTPAQYERMIVKGIRRLYIDTGRALEYDDSLFVKEEDQLYFDAVFPIDEVAYICLCAQIDFFKKVQSDVNNSFGYSTDALVVTNADKPYANLRDTIEKLENDRRILYYKMVRYTLGES